MFALERQQILESSHWNPTSGLLGYLEASIDDATSKCRCRSGFLEDAEVNDWLSQRGRFAVKDEGPGRSTTKLIRILMCERLGWVPLGFAMSKQSFLAVESAFHLPPETLPIFEMNSGDQHCRLEFNDNDGNSTPNGISLTIKLPQMFQLGNLGMALRHNLETRKTVVFMHGWHLFSNRNHVTDEKLISHAERFQQLIRSAHQFWAHPLLLPILLLKEHMYRADEVTEKLSPKVTEIERNLAVTASARLALNRRKMTSEMKRALSNPETRLQIVKLLSTSSTDLLNLRRVLKWDERYVQWLHRVDAMLREHHDHRQPPLDLEILNYVDYLNGTVLSTGEFIDSLRSRLDIQFNVLYNFVAQSGNDLNLKIAAAAGLDSAAMKTLAFVTMAFLPATFVASLFSTPMFDSEPEHTITVPRFPIFWAIILPLTLGIFVIWRVWWHFQKSYYSRVYLNQHSGGKDEDDEATFP